MKKIKTGTIERTLSIANTSAKTGLKFAANWVKSKVSGEEVEVAEFLSSQAEFIASEVSKLKGPLMKVGQMISTFGKGVVPDEVVAAMKKLQSESEPVDWSSIEKTLKRQFTAEQLAELEIDQTPYAAASLGQVHRATIKKTGEELCLKVQYPGVDKAIDTDMKAFRKILSAAGFITREEGFDEILKEVKQMLQRETDYTKEKETTELYQEIFRDDPRYKIPKVFAEYSTKRILATEFCPGASIDSDEVAQLSQDRRNKIGYAMLDHYFKEFFELRHVQTDPHFGNYAIEIDQDGNDDRLIMYDFGAFRKIPKTFHDKYMELLRGSCERDYERTLNATYDIGILIESDKEFFKNLHVFICFIVVEAFMPADDDMVKVDYFDKDGNYDWGESDLFERVNLEARKFPKKGYFRPPPREFLFINRKTLGVFNFLKKIRAQINGSQRIQKYL